MVAFKRWRLLVIESPMINVVGGKAEEGTERVSCLDKTVDAQLPASVLRAAVQAGQTAQAQIEEALLRE